MRRSRALPVLVLLLCGACTLPDMGPFSKSTAELNQGVKSIHHLVKSDLEFAGLTAAAQTWQNDFGPTVAAGSAIVRYSNALAAIVESGNSGQENAQKLATSLAGLAGAFGAFNPAGGAAAAGTQIAGIVTGLVLTAIAAHELEEVMESGDAVVRRLAPLMRAQLATAKRKLTSNENRLFLAIQNGLQLPGLGRATAFQEWQSVEGAIAALDPDDPDDVAKAPVLHAQRAALEPDWRIVSAELSSIKKRYAEARRLIDELQPAFDAWAETHAGILESLKEDRSFDWHGLLTAAVEIKRIVDNLDKE